MLLSFRTYTIKSDSRRERCQQSLEALNIILEADEFPIDTKQTNQQIHTWLNSLKANLREYNSRQMVRTVNAIDYQTEEFQHTRNYIDDAIKAFDRISKNTHLPYQVHGRYIAADYVLGMVWTAINEYESMSTLTHDIEEDQINIKYALLKGLAEIVEDDGRLACDRGSLGLLLRPLQGYIHGINIDMVSVQHESSMQPKIDGKQFSLGFNQELNKYIQNLPTEHPLQLLIMTGELYPNVSAKKLKTLLARIKGNWISAAKALCGHNENELQDALDGIEQTVKSYTDLLQDAKVDKSLQDFRGDLDSDIETLFYGN